MSYSFGVEKGYVARPPATAQLMVDSRDRDFSLYGAGDFQITRPQNLQNGYFTRVSPTEIALDWCYNNIYTDVNRQFTNQSITLDISGTASNTYNDSQTVVIPRGNYTVEEVLDSIVAAFNALSGTTGATFSILKVGNAYLDCSGAVFQLGTGAGANADSVLENQLSTDQTPLSEWVRTWNINNPDLRSFRYIDFVSEQLVAQQKMRDSTTNSLARDVLCRFYFDEDTQETYDGYGYPILMGYRPFKRRRLFNPAKQIAWDNNIPVGSISFQLYGMPSQPNNSNSPELIQFNILDATEWCMTLQLQES